VVEETAGRGVSRLTLVGRHDLRTAGQLQRALLSLLLRRGVVVDVRRAEGLDDTIAAVLERTRRRGEGAGRRLVLLVDEPVPEVLNRSGEPFLMAHDRDAATALAGTPVLGRSAVHQRGA
jgi:anti-anti-sigma regulatory factor